MENNLYKKSSYLLILLVTSLGNFVDYADMFMATLVRDDAIRALGIAQTKEAILKAGLNLEAFQATGFFLGCFTWGIFADKKGRLHVLYVSTFVYSIANIVNGLLSPSWEHVYYWYGGCRLFSGWGLSAEFSIAITIVVEFFSVRKRIIGTMLMTGLGFTGVFLVSWLKFYTDIAWHQYFIWGGVAGLLLLAFRFTVQESFMFLNQPTSIIKKGSLVTLLTKKKYLKKILLSVSIILPLFLVQLIIKFSANISQQINSNLISIALVLLIYDVCSICSDILGCYISYVLNNRIVVLKVYLVLLFISLLIFAIWPPLTSFSWYWIYVPLLAFTAGYWACWGTMISELIGINLRATTTTFIINLSRSFVLILTVLFKNLDTTYGFSITIIIIALLTCGLAFWAIFKIPETAYRDLEFVEK
ncbi:MAG: hypothetical protein ORN85_07610 [Sediminibacterium sp.]|nr:hypothetical protein [Sediminibacterium sp.]